MTSLEGNGSLDNVRRLVGQSSTAYRGMVFQDSDIYKTLEAVAWVLGQQEMPELREFLDSTAALLEEAQDEDGYLNSWFQGVHPEQRWQDLRWGHEMYCAGHLVQAAVAAARAAGHEGLLNTARRFADLLVRRFGDEFMALQHPPGRCTCRPHAHAPLRACRMCARQGWRYLHLDDKTGTPPVGR